MGYAYNMITIFIICIQQVFGKILYARNPTLNSTHILFMNGLVGSTVYLIYMNRKIPFYLYTGVGSAE